MHGVMCIGKRVNDEVISNYDLRDLDTEMNKKA